MFPCFRSTRSCDPEAGLLARGTHPYQRLTVLHLLQFTSWDYGICVASFRATKEDVRYQRATCSVGRSDDQIRKGDVSTMTWEYLCSGLLPNNSKRRGEFATYRGVTPQLANGAHVGCLRPCWKGASAPRPVKQVRPSDGHAAVDPASTWINNNNKRNRTRGIL